jgi:hypothetical protein
VFEALNERIEHYSNPASINFANNALEGRNKVDIALSVNDEDLRYQRQSDLTDSFFIDLLHVGETVFAFDNYQTCEPVVNSWLINYFLPGLRKYHNLRVVIAGHVVPLPTLEWQNLHQEIVLGGIPLENWIQFAFEKKSQAHHEFIKGFWHYCKGHPMQMAQAILSFS